MRSRRALTALAALSGVSAVGFLTGCSVAPSMSAHALAEAQAAVRASHSTSAPTPHPIVSAVPTPSATSSTASAVTKPSSKPTSSPTPHTSTEPKPKSTPTPTPSATPTYEYTDGKYSAQGSYTSPGGNETLRVNLTIANDVIQSIYVHSVHVDSTAREYESRFESGISGVAVGKDLATLDVGAVGGSSLTCIGFNAAIVTIRNEAKK
ncbi:MAG TPA: hypothetical protein VHX87_06030 [Galbitalea sp.]|jgi:hypothetical protein|nr:hypothetical protein [Galbitalea sp.]